MNNALKKKLNKRKEEGTIRSLSHFEGLADFFSNDYLGLSGIQISQPVDRFGGTGSRLISGNHHEAEQCERFLSEFFGSESALVFNSGYDANLGFFSSVPQKGDTVLYDQYIHASVRDGLRLSSARSHGFRHNDVNDLERLINRSEGTVFVVVEGVYSMNGDAAPLKEIADMCHLRGCLLVVDEAHSAGIFGTNGKGLCEEMNVLPQVYARVVTFGKAFGAHGACVLSDRITVDFLINFARSFIYTTAMPPESYMRIKMILERTDIEERRTALQERIRYFLLNIGREQIPEGVLIPIQMIKTGGAANASRVASRLQEEGFAVKAVFSPTVEAGNEGVRICLHSFNQLKDIKDLCTLLRASGTL